MNRRKIIYVITRMVVGGAQETAKFTAEHFHRAGDDVLFVTGEEGGREGQLTVDAPVMVMPELARSIHPVRDVTALWKLWRLFRRVRPDVVHSRTAKARFITAFAGRLARVPVVVQTIHGFSFNNEIDRRRAVYIALERLVARLYTRNIVVSEADREEGEALRILRPETTVLIRSGVNLAKFDADDRAAADLRSTYAPRGEKIVTLVGRLSSPKTPEVFVDAAAQVLRQHPSTRFLIVGDGPKREALQQQISTVGVADRVVMLGLRMDVGALMSASDVVVHSSLKEGLPKTVLEAMAAGRPVVASDVGGVPAVVEDGVTGLLVPPADSAALAAAIDRILSNDTLAADLARVASARLPQFSLEKTIRDTDALYDELLARRRRR